jgi:hypothetical protein
MGEDNRNRKTTGRDRRPPSRTPQDGAIWIWAVFVWYCAMLDGFQPSNTVLDNFV